LKKALVTALNRTLPQLKRSVQTKNLSGPTKKGSVRKQSGKLRGSITFTKARAKTTDLGSSTAIAEFRFTSLYARTHIGKRGRKLTIRPKRARHLAIPTRFARKGTGEPIGSGPRDPRWGDTFVARDIIFGRTGKTARSIRPLFILKKKVVVPVRIDVGRNIVKVGQAIFNKEIRQQMERILA
jgi:hypothetical protein